ncbi:unnamed protein product [Chrysoparadoxa australica]
MPAAKKQKVDGENQFQQLGKYTTVVCDTGEIEAIKKFQPTDATTNPSLIFKAAGLPEYQHLVDDAVAYAKKQPGLDAAGQLDLAMDKVAVNFGAEITKVVPGYVSTEVDARLSFDTEATIAKGRKIIELYKEAGIDKSRVLIKIACTWEGIKACEVLQKEGITCNMTLLFSLAQAAACAEAGATLISPFVGRILDWHKKKTGKTEYPKMEDPGVVSVSNIYGYYKKYGYKTIVMGASFRNIGEIQALAGCDRLTIAPTLLEELSSTTEPLPEVLSEAKATFDGDKLPNDVNTFRWMMNEDAMATEKLAEGIRGFGADIVKLENIIKAKLA